MVEQSGTLGLPDLSDTHTTLAPAPLTRDYAVIVIEYDGTELTQSRAELAALAGIMSALLRVDVWLVLVTPSDFEPLSSALSDLVATAVRHRLLVCSNNGTVVHGYTWSGDAVVRWEYAATEEDGASNCDPGQTEDLPAFAWLEATWLPRRGLSPVDVLVLTARRDLPSVGRGFGRRERNDLRGATVVQIGEPFGGASDGMRQSRARLHHLRALLADQAWRRASHRAGRRAVSIGWIERALRRPADFAWGIEEHGFVPALEHEVESRLTIGNGFLGVRGSIGQPTAASLPRTYVAGLFGTPPEPRPLSRLLSAPDWLRLHFSVDGQPTTVSKDLAPLHPRILDLSRAALLSTWMLRDAAGPLAHLHAFRCVSLADRALALQTELLEVERPLWIEMQATLAPVDSELVLAETGPAVQIWRALHGDAYLAVAGALTLQTARGCVASRSGDSGIAGQWGWLALPDDRALLTRVVAVARDVSAAAARQKALTALERAKQRGVRRLLAAHNRAWERRWAASDIVLEGDEDARRALRFAVYHLLIAANPHDERVSIGARALTGDAYLGHVFWDTEIFLLPFYIYTWPAAARALLLYRFHGLPAARAKAVRLGYRGALYAWESAGTGEDVTPPWVIGPDGLLVRIRCGTDEQHINAAIAYAVWQYWQATGDRSFVQDAGAEMLLETARFWASRATREQDGRYHIRGVIGPDEYHEGVDDNAYTNRLARWNLERGLEVAQLFKRRWPARWQALSTALALDGDELEQWRRVASGMTAGRTLEDGVVEQFDGYFDLEPIDLANYEARTAPMDVLLGPERTRRSQVIKQADVLMVVALLPDEFTPAERAANFRYYEPRCGHGSSLSPALHALVAARLGDTDLAQIYFAQAAAIDRADAMGNAAGGVHIATQGGLWQTAVFGFAGMQPTGTRLRFEPHLPEEWQTLSFTVQFRGRSIQVVMESRPTTCMVTLMRGRPLQVSIGDVPHRLQRSAPWRCIWEPWERRWREDGE